MKKTEAHNKLTYPGGRYLYMAMGLAALLFIATPAMAQKSLDDAVRKASNNGTRQVISAQTVQKKNKQTHVVRVLTNKGKVKTLRYPGGQRKQAPKQQQKKSKNPKG